MQLDEKWAFVYKKQHRCDLEDQPDHTAGDCWDHVAFDPEHRLVLDVVFGKRSATKILELLKGVKRQLQDRVPRLVTSDEFSSYLTTLRQVWPQAATREPDQRCTTRTRYKLPGTATPDPTLNYATVCKQREQGRVVSVRRTVVVGTEQSVAAALRESRVSRTVNTSFLERHNATDRHRNARKARRTYRFSKDWDLHHAVGYFSYFTYNFCWPVRTLAEPIKDPQGKAKRSPRTPAMSAGLTDHVWPLQEWLEYPVAGLSN